jgi:hypothetical protein
MNKPRFITFTGADDRTNIDDMEALSSQYPIEWGILFSKSRQGELRYPSWDFIDQLAEHPMLPLSAHICGQWSTDLLCYGKCPEIEAHLCGFSRCQVNTKMWLRPQSIRRVSTWAKHMELTTIFQCRSVFPEDRSVEWLYDCSGGEGILYDSWPEHPSSEVQVGYAGGIRPENVKSVIAQLQGPYYRRYWIDLETGVRDADNRFSIDLCRQVCEAVYR